MEFNFCFFNFNNNTGRETYHDMTRILSAHLVDLGHTVTEHDHFQNQPVINIVMEGFDDGSLGRLRNERNSGKRIVMLVTEMATRISERSFLWNNRVDTEYWMTRARVFPECVSLVDACWCLITGMKDFVKKYKQQSYDIELGYSPKIEVDNTKINPPYDFCIFGQKNIRRDERVAQLRRSGYSVQTIWGNPTLPPIHERDALIAQSKVVLDVKHFDWWPIVSTARIGISLHNSRPCFCESRGYEQTQVSKWEKFATFGKDDKRFLNDAEFVLKNYKDIYQKNIGNFRQMDAYACLGKAVKQTITYIDNHPLEEIRTPEPIIVNQPNRHATPSLVGSHNGVNFVEYNNVIYFVPQRLGNVDFTVNEDRMKPGIREFRTLHEAMQAAG